MSKRVPSDALDRFYKSGLIPKDGLVGVEIFWVGPGGGKEANHVKIVSDLWKTYFEKTRAKVIRMGRPSL